MRATALTRPFGVINIWRTPYAVAARFADIQEIMARPDVLPVPYNERADAAGWGPSFLLAKTEMNSEYFAIRKTISSLWKVTDKPLIRQIITASSESILQNAIDNHHGELDGAKALVHVVVPTLFTEYFGVPLSDEEQQEIISCSITIGGFVFGPGTPKTEAINTAQHAHARVTGFVERAVDAPKNPATQLHNKHTVMHRARRLLSKDPALRQQIIDLFIDMIVGCATPTVGGACRMLDLMLREPSIKDVCEQQAQDPKQDFNHCVHESLRMAFIVPGLWRRTHAEVVLNDVGFSRNHLKKDRYVFMAMQAAMYDHRRYFEPKHFRPERSDYSKLVFGYQEHNCIGGFIAEIVIAETFRPLLHTSFDRLPGSQTRWAGLIPFSIPLRFHA